MENVHNKLIISLTIKYEVRCTGSFHSNLSR